MDEDQIDMIVNWSQDFRDLEESTNERESGLIRELSMLISDVFSQLGSTSELIPCSIKEEKGLDLLFGYLQRLFDSDKSKFYWISEFIYQYRLYNFIFFKVWKL